MSLKGCGSAKGALENSDALNFSKTTYTKWVSGIPGGGAGYNFDLTLTRKQEDILLEKIVFKNWIVPLNSKDGLQYYASINDGTNNNTENTIDESIVKSSPTIDSSLIPIALQEDEALIFYTQKGKEKYYKLKLEKPSDFNAPRY